MSCHGTTPSHYAAARSGHSTPPFLLQISISNDFFQTGAPLLATAFVEHGHAEFVGQYVQVQQPFVFFHVRPRFLLTMIHSSPEYRSTLDSFCTAGYCIVVPPPDMQQYTSSLSPHCPRTPQHPLKKRFCHMSLSKSVK